MPSKWWSARLEHNPKAKGDPPEYQDNILPLYADALDAIARERGLQPLSEFFFDEATIEDELHTKYMTDKFGEGFSPEDIDEETYAELPIGPRELRDRYGPFFDAAAGLATVQRLLAHVAGNPGAIAALKRGFVPGQEFTDEAVTNQLTDLEAVLKFAKKTNRRFRLGLPEFEP